MRKLEYLKNIFKTGSCEECGNSSSGCGFPGERQVTKEWIAVGPDPARGRCAEAIYMPYNEFPPEGEEGDITIRFTKLSTGVRPEALIPPKTIVTSEFASGAFQSWTGPGKILLISLEAAGRNNAEAVIALGWWEEPICQLETVQKR